MDYIERIKKKDAKEYIFFIETAEKMHPFLLKISKEGTKNVHAKMIKDEGQI